MAVTSARLRRLVFQAHLWIALILFLPLVPLGLTGSALVWPEVVNRLTNPAPQVAAEAQAGLAPSAYIDAATAALPQGARVTALRLPAEPGAPVAVSASLGGAGPAGGRVAWIHPASGEVIKVASSTSPLFVFSHDFHGHFLVDGAGRQLVGWAGVAMLILSLTGLYLWWPRGAFAKAFRWRRTPDFSNNLHHLVGFWIALPLALVSLTGIFISFPPLTAAVFGAPPPRPAPVSAPATERVSLPATPLGPDQIVAAAQSGLTGARLISLSAPPALRPGAPPAGPAAWRVELDQAGTRRTVRVDAASGQVIAAPPPAPAAPSGARALIRGLHDGAVGGEVWKWLLFLTGVLPLVLAGTGVYLWARNELRKTAQRRRVEASA